MWRQLEDDGIESTGSLGDPVYAMLCAFGVSIAGVLLTDATTGILQWVCVGVGAIAGAYGLYLFAILAIFILIKRTADRASRAPRRESGEHKRWSWLSPTLVALVVPLDWALTVWIYDFDRSETLFTGLAAALGSAAILVTHALRPPGGEHTRLRR